MVAQDVRKVIVSVVGPTAVGKTELAFLLAQEAISSGLVKGASLISADSRQVYRGLPAITGVDKPEQLPDSIEVFGQELIEPDEEWSLSAFQKMAWEVITNAWRKGWLPIVVGGTGLYYTHLLTPELHDKPGPNMELREELEGMDAAALRARLAQAAPHKLATLNPSDSQNPRRLIRALEIAESSDQPIETTEIASSPLLPDSHLTFGLLDDIELIEERIIARVHKRWDQALKEVSALESRYSFDAGYSPTAKLPALSATGVKEVLAYLQGTLSKEEALELWIRRERQYAKRQLTWWKKYGSDITWFNRSNHPNLEVLADLIFNQSIKAAIIAQ